VEDFLDVQDKWEKFAHDLRLEGSELERLASSCEPLPPSRKQTEETEFSSERQATEEACVDQAQTPGCKIVCRECGKVFDQDSADRRHGVCTCGGELDFMEDSPEATPMPWLRDWLESIGLLHYLPEAIAWCREMGACYVEEIREIWEEFAEDLMLTDDERQLLAVAFTMDLNGCESADRADVYVDEHRKLGWQEQEEEEEEREEVDSNLAAAPCWPWLRVWLKSAGLLHRATEAVRWCESEGAAESDLLEAWDEFADALQLEEFERLRLEQACSGRSSSQASASSGLGQAMRLPRSTVQTADSPYLHDDSAEASLPSRTRELETFGPPENPYTVLEQLGRGATAHVFKCVRGEDHFAVKVIDLERLRMQPRFHYLQRILERETDLLLHLRHEKIVQIRDVFKTPEKLFLVLDLVEGGDLFEHLYNKGMLSEDEARYVFVQIVDALAYIHSKNIIHRDLKLENILVDSAHSMPGFIEVKISDFGHSKLIRDGYTQANTACGTPQYWAPEQQMCGISLRPGYDERVDLWALGVVLYVMLTNKLPFESTIDSQVGIFKFKGSRKAEELIRGLIRVAPEERMSLEQCLQSPWVSLKLDSLPNRASRGSDFDEDVEVRVRLPEKPKKLDTFKEQLCAYGRRLHVAAKLQVLEVVITFRENSDPHTIEQCKDELWQILTEHFPKWRCPSELKTAESIDEATMAKWTEEQALLEAIYHSDFEAVSVTEWEVRLDDDTLLRIILRPGYPQKEPPKLVLESSRQVGGEGLLQNLLKSWVPGEACVYQWAEHLREAIREPTSSSSSSEDAEEEQDAEGTEDPCSTQGGERSREVGEGDAGKKKRRRRALREADAMSRRAQGIGQGEEGSAAASWEAKAGGGDEYFTYEPKRRSFRGAPRSVRDGQRERVFAESTGDPSHRVPITHGPAVVEKRSKFQAHFAPVANMDQVNWVHRQLLSDTQIASATHNTVGYRFHDSNTGIMVLDYDDDHEAGAGRRLAHLLQNRCDDGVFVMVSRWYGGIELGTDRFKIINRVARELLEKNGILSQRALERNPRLRTVRPTSDSTPLSETKSQSKHQPKRKG